MATGGKVVFTAKRVNDFSCSADKASAFLWDADTKGLGLKVSAGGSKQFILETRLQTGKSVRLTIGAPNIWTIETARNEARRLQVLVDQGIDPREQTRKKKEADAAAKAARDAQQRELEQKNRFTLSALCNAYAEHLRRKGKTKTATDVKSAFKVHVLEAHPSIAACAAREITAHQVAAIIRKVRENGKERTAGILRNYLVAAFNTARRAPFDSAISGDLIEFEIVTNPAEIVPAIPVKRGSRTLSVNELRDYIQLTGDDETGQALRLALYTGGQRMAQLLRAKVRDYDSHTQTLRLWDGKGKRLTAREHLIPVGQNADQLITKLIASRKNADDHIFNTSERMAGNRVSRISETLKCEPFDLRDIRRTVETMLASLGVNKDIRAQLLSHGISGVQAAHYDRHDYIDEKRTALLLWEAHLGKISADTAETDKIHPARPA